jgi:hypothetical protein
MAGQNNEKPLTLAHRARFSAILVIARLWPGQDFDQIETRFDLLSARHQTEITVSVLGYLFLLALFAGQFGVLGIMLYLVAVLVTIR